MPRPLRFVLPYQMVEVTIRTIQSRLLLRPSEALNAAILSVLGRALERYDVKLHGFAIMSNHAHFLVTPANACELASFMRFVNRNISEAVGRLHDWKGPMWDRRYRSIPVVDDASQVERLRYILAHGCKEGLVQSPLDWPGLHCARALLGREELCGTWVDRAALFRARRDRTRTFAISEFEKEYRINLEPLPCWRGISREQHRSRCAEMVAEIERAARHENRSLGRMPLGPNAVRAQEPHEVPVNTSRRPAPLVHAASAFTRNAFRAAYNRFVEAFRAAADRLRHGVRDIQFPPYAFPPAGPFVIAHDLMPAST